jgi:peptide/nickel transport system substrate-binding protein
MERYARAAIAAALIVLAGGCSTNPQASTNGAGANAAIPGTLRIADIEEPDSLNPYISTVITSIDLSLLWGEYFFNIDNHDRFVPEVALAVPTLQNGGISADGLTITYHLRHGIKWQDGVPLTSRDVVFTWHAIMNPNNNVQVSTGYDQIAAIDTPDDYTVIVHMKQRFSPIIAYFMGLEGGGPILPAHILAALPNMNRVPFDTLPVGAGPFKVTEWQHGDHVTLVANPNYWRGAPKLHEIIYKWVGSSSTIETELQTGEADAWFRADASLYPQLSAMPGHTTLLTPYSLFGHVDFNMRDPMLQDVRLRRAIMLGIDRHRIIHDATYDVFLPSNSDQPAFSWAYDRDLPPVTYNPVQAAALLDAAGWKPGPDGIRVRDGQRLSVQLSYISGQVVAPRIGNIMAQELKQIGVELTQKTYPSAIFFAAQQNGGIVNKGQYQLAYYGWINGVDPDDSSLYWSREMPPNGQDSLFWKDPVVDAAEVDALNTFDVARRKEDYSIIQHELLKQVPTIIMFAEQRVDVFTNAFKGYVPSPAQSSDWNSWQWSVDAGG